MELPSSFNNVDIVCISEHGALMLSMVLGDCFKPSDHDGGEAFMTCFVKEVCVDKELSQLVVLFTNPGMVVIKSVMVYKIESLYHFWSAYIFQ